MKNEKKDSAAVTEAIGKVITNLHESFDRELMALGEEELADRWFWSWDEERSIEWNIYHFSDLLELHKRMCRRWEERHNGSVCVVERVRDKYIMPRVKEFHQILKTHMEKSDS